MTRETKGEKPDYLAMADVLEQIARDIRLRLSGRLPGNDSEQAERLERLAAEIKASIA